MLDVLLLVVLGWTGLYGAILGSYKTIMRVSVVVGELMALWVLIPWLNLKIGNIHVQNMYYQWLKNFFQPVWPVVSYNIQNKQIYLWKSLFENNAKYYYIRILYLGYIVTIFAALMMYTFAFEIVKESKIKIKTNQFLGIITGLGIGVYLDAMLVKIILYLGWLFQQKGLQAMVQKSELVHIWFSVLMRGIF